jgi:hypothetical protein
MFNVELPPDSSWKWSTGITTEDQNEIKRLEFRVKELEEDLADMFNVGPVCLNCQRLEVELEKTMGDAADFEAKLAAALATKEGK